MKNQDQARLNPVQQIKENQKALVIFPTGTRYSNEMKGGAVMIARLAKPYRSNGVSRTINIQGYY